MVGQPAGPADFPYTTLFRSVCERGRERAEIIVAARREGHRVRVSEIDIGEGDGAAGIEIATVVDVGTLGHRAGLGGGGDYRYLVGANDGDGHRLGRAQPVTVGDGDVVGDSEGLADGEEIKGLVGCAIAKDDRARAGARAV